MAAVIFSVIFALIGVVSLTGSVIGIEKQYRIARVWAAIAGVVCLVVIAPAIFFLGGFATVPTKSVGVVTSFGKVGAEYGPGGHWLAPWKTLNIVSDTIQSDKFDQSHSDGNGNPLPDVQTTAGDTGYCITVRLGGQQQGCADVQLQIQVRKSAIPELYANYSSYGSNLSQDVDQYVVKRELTTDLNRVLGDYSPIADVSVSLQACLQANNAANCNTQASSQFSKFDPPLLAALRSDPELAGKVDVLDINLQLVHYDSNTENALQKIQQDFAETVAAKIQEQTNAAISLANAALVRQKDALTPAVLANECYQTTQMAVKAGYALPAGWNCSGSGAGVIVQGK